MLPGHEGYAISGGQARYDRLQLLAAERRSDTVALLDRVDVAPGMACLDLGCGGGAVTFELAERVGPAGSVTGIDLDDVKLELARAVAAEKGPTQRQIRSRRSDVLASRRIV